MQKLFTDTRKLDSSCRASYGLTEEIMMENAAVALEKEIHEHAAHGDKIIILCGSGNNGADGYTLARHIRLDYDVQVLQCGSPSSPLCQLQSERAEKCGISFDSIKNILVDDVRRASVVVDCIFGSGFHGGYKDDIAEQILTALNDVNSASCWRVACDVPTGIHGDGTVASAVFKADVTVSMGALKLSLFSDMAKDFVGEIKVGNLGVTRSLYENSCSESLENTYLLEEKDMVLPYRTASMVNKGTFGSAYIACGTKTGASLIAANACFKFGAGLVTLIRPDKNFGKEPIPGLTMELLLSSSFGTRVSAVCAGMGLGYDEAAVKFYTDYLLDNPEVRCVLDADILYSPLIIDVLSKRGKGCVLTPHPKELTELLRICGLGEYNIDECIMLRRELVEKFCRRFPEVVLVAKGSNPIIGVYTPEDNFKAYINSYGTPALAKGGSGDALAGMICSLLTQGYEPLDAAVTASIAHALASRKVKNDFALTPSLLIDKIDEL